MTVEHYVLLGRTPHLRAARPPRAAADFDVVDARPRPAPPRPTGRPHPRTRCRAGSASGPRSPAPSPRNPACCSSTSRRAALDIGHQQDVLELIDALRLDLGLTVVSTMHDLTLAAQYGDHLVLLAGGRVVASGPPVQVLTGPTSRAHYGAHVDVIRHAGRLVVVPCARTPDRTGGRPDART